MWGGGGGGWVARGSAFVRVMMDLDASIKRLAVGNGNLLNLIDAFFSFSGNIANYLKLSEIDSMYLPVPVNFIFIGFEGKGNHGNSMRAQNFCLFVCPCVLKYDFCSLFIYLFIFVCLWNYSEFKLGSEELERWFTKIDHIFEHTRVPRIGEALTPFYKISIDKVQRHHLPLISHISYK